jgi:hypothetical protein
MPISVSVHFEQSYKDRCSICGSAPSYKTVITVGTEECAIVPRCIDCCVNRVGSGVAMEPQINTRMSPQKKKRISRQKELGIMNDIGGRRQPASGACSGYKGDVKLEGVTRIENKFTTKNSYILKRKELNKIRSECQGYEKPAFVIDFTDAAGKTEDRWTVIQYTEWEKFINATKHS